MKYCLLEPVTPITGDLFNSYVMLRQNFSM